MVDDDMACCRRDPVARRGDAGIHYSQPILALNHIHAPGQQAANRIDALRNWFHFFVPFVFFVDKNAFPLRKSR